jgi:glycosyltransferase involved in cell wall biosynthesis
MRLQVDHIARELGRRHEVCVVGFRWPEQQEQELPFVDVQAVEAPSEALAARAGAFARGSVRGEPAAVVLFTAGIREKLAQVLAERTFDVAHVAVGVMAGTRPLLGSLPAIVTGEAWHLNMAASRALDPPWLRPFRRLEERRVRRFQARAFAGFARVVMVTEQDAALVRELDASLTPAVIPNGVDPVNFVPLDDRDGEPGHLVFTGALGYPPNVAAARLLAEEILPRVRAAVPHARLSIVGRAPGAEVWRLARLEGVQVVADVPDIRPWLWRGQVYVCPMVNGTGIKNKLLEALACGRPAVATSLACQGMHVHSDQQLLIAEGKQELAAAVVRLLGDANVRSRLGAAARAYVLEYHSWASVAAAYEQVYQEAVSAGPPDDRAAAGRTARPSVSADAS